MKGEVVLNEKIIAEKDGFILRLAQAQDAQPYFHQNYCPLDPEAARLTGSKTAFEKDEVMSFFLQLLDQQDRVFFLIIAPDGRIIGESVINEIDWELRCANFRIGIFHPAERDRGIGAWAIERTRDFAFEQLGAFGLPAAFFVHPPGPKPKQAVPCGARRPPNAETEPAVRS